MKQTFKMICIGIRDSSSNFFFFYPPPRPRCSPVYLFAFILFAHVVISAGIRSN